MSIPTSPLFATEVVDCVKEGRAPSVHELFVVAERIWSDGGANRSAFAWNEMPRSSAVRLDAMRAAQLALCGEA